MRINVREKFCRSFPWTRDIKWFDLTGYLTLTGARRVKIELDYRNYVDHYSAFTVTVINANEGKIDQKVFAFSDYLDVTKRKDDRQSPSAPHYYPTNSFHAWADRGTLDWYIAVPADLRPLTTAIEEYISIFE